MKRITVSLPDELVDTVKRAAGGERKVSSYVAAALTEYSERQRLDELLAEWEAETPISDAARRHAEAELDRVGLLPKSDRSNRAAG